MELLNGKIRVDRSGGNPGLVKFIFNKILISQDQSAPAGYEERRVVLYCSMV